MSDISIIENTFFATARYWGKLNFPVFKSGAVWSMQTGIHSADLNMAWSEKPLEPDDAPAVRQIIDAFKANALPFWWWMFPCAKSASTIDILKLEGFSFTLSIPCMLADLRLFEEEKPEETAISVSHVRNKTDLNLWKEVSFAGFDFPASTKGSYAGFVDAFNLRPDSPQRLYLAYCNDRPAATSLLFLQEDKAGIYFVSTLSEYRKKGIGLALTREMMRHAKMRGVRSATLQSSPDGLHVYQRAGFKEQCLVDVYSLKPI